MKKSTQHLTIGNQIIKGPRSIFPPNSGHSWLEKDISIYVHYYIDKRIQHISLWSDSTMNKEDNFLKPVIRFVHWEKQNDLEKYGNGTEIDWPDIRIFLGHIKPDMFEKLNSGLIELQQLISSIHFAPLGISLNRDVATVDTDFSTAIEVWVRNGVQSFSYYTPYIDNDIFCQKVIAFKQLLHRSIDKIDHAGWQERYNSPFNDKPFDWDYNQINQNLHKYENP